MHKTVLVLLAGSLALSMGPASTTTAVAGGDHDWRGPGTSRRAETLYQFGRFDTFRGTYPGQTTGGLYDGFVRIGRVLAKGDTGLGASDRVDGESIVIDGRVYQLGADEHGHADVTLSHRSDTTPFTAVTTFGTDARAWFTDVASLGARNTDGSLSKGSLMRMVEELIATHPRLAPAGDPDRDTTFGPTYVFRMSGKLSYVQSRTFTTPEKVDGKYPTLPTVVANQTVFVDRDVWADLVVVWCPPEMGAAGVNVGGTHVHWISKDRTRGGHVLDLEADRLKVRVDKTPYFRLIENPAAPTAR